MNLNSDIMSSRVLAEYLREVGDNAGQLGKDLFLSAKHTFKRQHIIVL